MSIYIENGYKNRPNYIKCLADKYKVPVSVVLNLANLLGKEEDFDGLVSLVAEYGRYELFQVLSVTHLLE
jgi:hypothetical protein